MRRTLRVAKQLNVRPSTGSIAPSHRSFTSGLYRKANDRYVRVDDRHIIAAALTALAAGVASGPQLTTSGLVRDYLAVRLGGLQYEVFCCVYLDARYRVIECENLFRGSVTGAEIHTREVAKQALIHNAEALIVCHNHPSGVPEPSIEDRRISVRLRDTLELIDVKLLDHVIIGAGKVCSMAERGLI